MTFRALRSLGPIAIVMLCGCLDSDPNPNGPSVEPRSAVKAPAPSGSAMQPKSLADYRREKLQDKEKEANSSGGAGPGPASAQ